MKPIINCYKCNIKLGLVYVKCRCGNAYCNQHKYEDQHNCSYNYKQQGQQQIKRDNPAIHFKKVDII